MKKSIWLLVVLAAIAIWWVSPDALWKYLFFLRVPILMGLVLIFLPVLAQYWLPAMLKNLFVLRGGGQITFVIVSAVAAGMSVVLATSLILHNAATRFAVPVAIDIPKFWQYVMAIALSSYICITTINLSKEKNSEITLQNNVVLWSTVTGGGLSIGLLFLVDLTRKWLSSNAYLKEILGGIASLAKHGTAGYINPQSGELTSGHLAAIAFLVIGTVIYLAVGLFFHPESKSRRAEAPALLYVLLLISIITLLCSGATFYLDYFRVPLLIPFLAYSAFTYFALGVDHLFELDPLSRDTGDKKAVDDKSKNFEQVLAKRLEHQTGERTLVIVCASGGGIQAAGWTAQVLKGLQQELGIGFTKAIGLISAVSGGSVGAMYYLDRFNKDGFLEECEQKTSEHTSKSKQKTSDRATKNSFDAATSDSLDAVGWGFAYLDLWRFLGFPYLIRPKFDRGTAVETDWQGEMKDWQKETNKLKTPKTLATWRKQIFEGKIPIPVFNATLVETGERFLITPMTFGKVHAKKYVDFNTLYEGYDMNVATAARLSATFPYVSPICRHDRKEHELADKKYHFADGGYFDNSGFVTAAEWLDERLDKWRKPETLNIRRVLILQINAFPESPANDNVQGSGGWFMTTLGPLLAMFKVRDPVLASRNAKEAKLLKERWERYKDPVEENPVDIQYFPIFFPSKQDAPEFYDKRGRYQPPLSWRLTDEEKQAIKDGWMAIKAGKTVQKLQQLWHETWKMSVPTDHVAED
jgi:hypothetical protein